MMENLISKTPQFVTKDVITIFDYLKTKNTITGYKVFIDPTVLKLPRYYHGVLLKQENIYKNILRTKKEHLDVQKALLEPNLKSFSHYVEIKKKISEINKKFPEFEEFRNDNEIKITPEFIRHVLSISKEVEHALMNDNIIIDNFCIQLTKLFYAVNSDTVDEQGIIDFVNYVNNNGNGLLLHYGNAIFAQCFNENPVKFCNLNRIIPANAASEITKDLLLEDADVICHSISTKITVDSLKHILEIVFAKKFSHNIKETILVKLDQSNYDFEISEILKNFVLLNYPSQLNTDLSILYKDGTREDVDIKSQCLNRISESPFVNIEQFEIERNKFVVKLLMEWERLLKREQEIAAQLGIKISSEKQQSFDNVKQLITTYGKTGEPKIIDDINEILTIINAI